MKKRTAVIGALVSLLPIGQPLVIGTGVVLASAGVMLSVPEKVNAESATFYIEKGNKNYYKNDYYGAISDYTKAIEIDPNYKSAYKNRGISKENIGDLQGACFDWRKTVYLSPNDAAAKWVRDQC